MKYTKLALVLSVILSSSSVFAKNVYFTPNQENNNAAITLSISKKDDLRLDCPNLIPDTSKDQYPSFMRTSRIQVENTDVACITTTAASCEGDERAKTMHSIALIKPVKVGQTTVSYYLYNTNDENSGNFRYLTINVVE